MRGEDDDRLLRRKSDLLFFGSSPSLFYYASVINLVSALIQNILNLTRFLVRTNLAGYFFYLGSMCLSALYDKHDRTLDILKA